MTPEPGRVLEAVAAALRGEVLPGVRTPFGQQVALLAGTAADLLAQEVDRLAERLHEENAAVAAVLADAAALLAQGELAEHVAAALGGEAESLRVSALQARNDVLRALLAEVHAAVEQLPSAEARRVDGRIWDEYRASVERRRVEVRM